MPLETGRSLGSVGSPVPRVKPDLLAEGMLVILDLPEPATREMRHHALFALLEARPRTVASSQLAAALDARIEALCRMHRSPVFRALVEADEPTSLSLAVRVAAEAALVGALEHEFEPEMFLSVLLAGMPATSRC